MVEILFIDIYVLYKLSMGEIIRLWKHTVEQAKSALDYMIYCRYHCEGKHHTRVPLCDIIREVQGPITLSKNRLRKSKLKLRLY